MNSVYRYFRAFFQALQMTLRGEKIPDPVQHPLVDWTKVLAALLDETYRAIDQGGLHQEARQTLKFRLDGRQISLETVLATVKFHATQEYPSLLKSRYGRDALNTIYASNFNDRYWITSVSSSESLQKPAIQAMFQRLQQHLDKIPPL